MKKRLIALILIIVMIGISGCITNKKLCREEEAKNEALKYLNANYSDTFKPKVYIGKNWSYDYETVTFTSEKYPDGIVEVIIEEKDDGKLKFSDNYYHYYMLDDAISYGESLVTDKDAIVKVRFFDAIISDELAGAKSFKEWVEQGAAWVEFFIITKNTLSKNDQEQIAYKVSSDKIYSYIYFITTDDENLLQDVTLDEIFNNQSKYIEEKHKYRINRDSKIEKEFK